MACDADRDGIIVVPRALAAEIADPSLEQEKLEAYVATKIQAGEPLWGNYPPGEQTIAQYNASRTAAREIVDATPSERQHASAITGHHRVVGGK